jgi:hypothetical protein
MGSDDQTVSDLEWGIVAMPQSELRLIKRCAEFRPQGEIEDLPRGLRGIYVLYKHRTSHGEDQYDVVYVGMARSGRRGGVGGRVRSHLKKKGGLWTHFSVFEVWDNVRDDEVTELEGLFRHIYRLDTRANRLNVQRAFKRIRKIRKDELDEWKGPAADPP